METGCLKMSGPTIRQWKVGFEIMYRHIINRLPLFAPECLKIIIRKWISSMLASCVNFCNPVCCDVVQEQIRSCSENSRLSFTYVIHVQGAVGSSVVSSCPLLWAAVRKPVFFWASRFGRSNISHKPFETKPPQCTVLLTLNDKFWSHEYVFKNLFVLLSFPQPCMRRPSGCPRPCGTSMNQTGWEGRTLLSSQR